MYLFRPAITLITDTNVATARITPNRVRKLLNLCARNESIASFSVSAKVTQALRIRWLFKADSAASRVTPDAPARFSIGVAPKFVPPQGNDFVETIHLFLTWQDDTKRVLHSSMGVCTLK